MMVSGAPFTNLNILVVGLAREGQAVARFLSQQGALVSVTDAKPADQLAGQLNALQDLDITFYLGGHPDHLLDPGHTDLLVVSPGVPLDVPFLQQAQAKGLPLTTESRLFCQLCPAPIVGISGSSGKTTTTTLVGLMLEAAGLTTYVGGNIGTPLINKLDQIKAQDRIVMELSSFQLEYFHPQAHPASESLPTVQPLLKGWSPKIGALLNITPNHLDRHGTMAAYTEAKLALVRNMGIDQTAILNLDDPVARQIGQQLSAQIGWFSLKEQPEQGACLVDGEVMLVDQEKLNPVCPVSEIKLRGQHNVYNILAACAISAAAGVPPEAMARVATTFSGVSHRLELVGCHDGVAYYNDSIATSPERLVAALKAFEEPIILLAGGKDKHLPWDEAARLILQRVKHLILFGEAGSLIAQAIERAQKKIVSRTTCYANNTLEEAVVQARELAQAGDVVLLSPGCASFDAYPDFVSRGEHFRALVQGFA